MSIIQCLIGRRSDIVLVEFTDYVGNFQQISRQLLRKLKNENILSIDYEDHLFYYIKENEFTYMCLCEKESNNIYSFLNDVKKKFVDTYDLDKVKSASSYQLQEFESSMKEIVEFYNCKVQNLTFFGLPLEHHTFPLKKIDLIFKKEEKINLIAIKNSLAKKNYHSLNYVNSKIQSIDKYQKSFYFIICVLCLLVFIFLIKQLFTNSHEDHQNTKILESENKNNQSSNNITQKHLNFL